MEFRAGSPWEVLSAALGLFGTAASCFGLHQATVYHRHGLCWNEIDYYLQVRQVHIETLNNLREDLRDMYEMDCRKIDNNMIVTTLMLSIGFGFVVEGTFPAQEPSDRSPLRGAYSAQGVVRVAYALVAGLALICPFWSMLCLMECRRRLSVFMEHFNDKFYDMLRHRFAAFNDETRSAQAMHTSNLVRYTEGLPRDPFEQCAAAPTGWLRCPSRKGLGGGCPCRRDGAPPPRRPRAPGDFGLILALHSDYATWWDTWCKRSHQWASVFHWLGILFNVLCCAVLLGMYFSFHYRDTPWMWRTYVLVVSAGLLLAVTCSAVACCLGPRKDVRRRHVQEGPSIPTWMSETTDFGRPLLDGDKLSED